MAEPEGQEIATGTVALELRKLALDVVAVEVVDLLAEHGIRSILLKGPAFGSWLYEKGESRPYSDIDLLVDPADQERLRPLLAAEGFRHWDLGTSAGERPHDQIFSRASDGSTLEVHWTLPGVEASDDVAWSALARGTEKLRLYDGGEVDVLGAPARSLLVALHAAHHGSSSPRPLEDLARALARTPENVWSDAASLARRVGAIEAMAAGLRLDPTGAALCEQLELPPGSSLVQALKSAGAPPPAIAVARLSELPGMRRKALFLIKELTPPPDFMRAAYPIAHRGPLGLSLAYSQRPFRLLRPALRGFRVWRSARRTRP